MGSQRAVAAMGIGALFLWAFAGGMKANDSSGAWQPPSRGGLAKLRALCSAAGLDEEWTQFLSFVSYGESGWNNLVGLGNPSLFPASAKPNRKASAEAQANEAAAAVKAYERNKERFVSCGHPAVHYQFGSGGWFGLLPANGLAKLDGTSLVCLSPFAVFDPPASIAMALGFARALMGWDGFKARPTHLNLRIGWGNPSAMGDAAILSAKRVRYEKHRKAVGLPAGWLDAEIPSRPPSNVEELYYAMKGVA